MLTAVHTFSAIEFCEQGDYVAAAEYLGIRAGERPSRGSQGNVAHATALLAAGAIASSVAGIQSTGDQVAARAMFADAAALFGEDPRAHTARAWMAWCDYWEGDLDTALDRIDESLRAPLDNATKFRTLLLKIGIYCDRGLASEALAELEQMAEVYEAVSPLLRGKFHLQRGRARKLAGEPDRAILEYEAALHFFEEAGNVRCEAVALNNMAILYSDAGRFPEAHEHANRARVLFQKLGDRRYEAESLDQIAQIFLAQGKSAEAEDALRLSPNSDQGFPDCSANRNGVKDATAVSSVSGFLTNIREFPCTPESPANQPINPERGSQVMSLPELASMMVEANPDMAAVFFSMLVLARSVRGDPAFDAEADEAESIFYSKMPDCEKHRNEARQACLIRPVTSGS